MRVLVFIFEVDIDGIEILKIFFSDGIDFFLRVRFDFIFVR